MSFTSAAYLLFLICVTTVNYSLPAKYRHLWLLGAGYFFYLTWEPAFSILLLCVTALSYLFGRKIASLQDKGSRKRWLVVSVVTLLLPLCFFKFVQFLSQHLINMATISAPGNPPLSHLYLLPVGLSFFTFQSVSYVADIYRGYLKPEPRFEKYALYMAFFPTLLAGPIERAKSILRQINNPVAFNYQNIRAGLQLILWGVFKKVVLADRMTYLMKGPYAEPEKFQGVVIYFAIIFSMFQLFCDFSAYSDIAVGSARMLGISLSKNFDDRVYAATSREIFWRGWHRSLTSWLRDYVFFPLSRNVRSRSRLYVNLLIVYLLVGAWHGATWGFIVWGLLNGLWLVAEHLSKTWRRHFFTHLGVNINGRAFGFLSWLFVFHVGSFFGVFFRSQTPRDALYFIGNLANSNLNLLDNMETKGCLKTLIGLLFMHWINRLIPRDENFDAFISRQPTWFRWSFYVTLAQLILRYSFVFRDLQFVYFRF